MEGEMQENANRRPSVALLVVAVVVVAFLSRPDLPSLHRMMHGRAEDLGGPITGALAKLATWLSHPFGVIRFSDYLVFSIATLPSALGIAPERSFLGIFGIWFPLPEWQDWNRSNWQRWLQPRCSYCVHGACIGPDICVCSPRYTGPHCNQLRLNISIGFLDYLLISWIILHLIYVTSAQMRPIFDRHFSLSLDNFTLHTLITSPHLHKSTSQLIANSLSLFSTAPSLISLFESEFELALFTITVSICSSIGALLADIVAERRWGGIGWRRNTRWVGASGLMAGMRTFVMLAVVGTETGLMGIRWAEYLALQLVLDMVILSFSPHALGSWAGGVLSSITWFILFTQ